MPWTSLVIYGCKLTCILFLLIMMFHLMIRDSPIESVIDDSYENVLPINDGLQNVSGDHYDLIINTYMRSGSTFLGKIFSTRPDTFYFFEPLWNAQQFAYYMGQNHICHYNENRCSKQGADAIAKNIGRGITLKKSLRFLQALLDCTFEDHEKFLPDPRRFPDEFSNKTHSWNFAKGQLWQPYNECARTKTKYSHCISRIKPVCRDAKHKVMKVLRTSLSSLEPLLKARQNLKIIQLFRDPRGIINSHLNTNFYKERVQNAVQIVNDIKSLCNRMRLDVTTALKFRQLYADRFRVVQYEDFSDLHHSARALYNLMKMDLTPEIGRKLENLIRPENALKGFHPYNYRTSLSWKIERVTNKHCSDVFQSLGYPLFTDKAEYTSSESVKSHLQYALDF